MGLLRSGDRFTFYTRNKWSKRICDKTGVRHFGIHAIRHLTATTLAGIGVAGIDIQHILRHRSLTTTERYVHQRGDLRVI
ncbi:MAG: tyrosine-type recombinase/integrase [Deltaproteobacteria bacterium]|nr:tyrosine-type recombinase/integrase [Deltaproteobacteria bacterium]